MKGKEIKKSKQLIHSLAELCINKIYENKYATNQKERYTNQINLIKKIFMKNSKLINDNKLNKNDINIVLIEKTNKNKKHQKIKIYQLNQYIYLMKKNYLYLKMKIIYMMEI